MEKTFQSVWVHSIFYGVKSYYNSENKTVITKTKLGDLYINFLFALDNLLYLFFDFYIFPRQGFEVRLINKEITDKDWKIIQGVVGDEI